MNAASSIRGLRRKLLRDRTNQPGSIFPRSPGIIPAVLSTTSFRPLRFDCSIKEHGKQCGSGAKFEAFVLNNFFTEASGE